MISVKINNLQSLVTAFKNAPDSLITELKNSAAESLQLLQRQAQSVHRFRSRSGNLISSIKTEQQELNGRVFVDEGQASYARFVIKGTKPHDIIAHGRALYFNGIFRRKVHNPGTAGDPFMDTAADSERDKVNDIFNRNAINSLRKVGINI